MSDNLKSEEYKVLARKYRPQTFNDLIGQETLVQTLSNSIMQNRIAHAYILTGVRGIGKTTTARLIAMSLNCDERLNDTCEPCGKCDSCVSIREDRNLDVLEMDAASKTGVDDIREIIDNVKYKPVSSKYKIFIIDEVHMLSKNAFNALLKTLEEPPSHIKFIFATTEVKKIPITIISRCQRFDLRRIENKNLNLHLLSISERENIEIDKDAISLIVRAAEGSVRDGLSLLDQAIANESEKITSDIVVKMLGLADRGRIFDLIELILQGKAPNSIKLFNDIHQDGADIVMIFNEMLNVVHFITQIKISPELKENIQTPESERLKGFEISEKISMPSLGLVWQILFKGYEELQSGYHLLQHGEMIIIRLIYLYDGPTPDDLIKKYEQKNKNEIVSTKINEVNLPNKENHETINHLIDKKDDNQGISKINKNIGININSFRHFVDLFYQNREGMLHTYLYNNAKLASFKEGEVEINTSSVADPHFTRTIAKLVSTWTDRIWQVNSSTSNIGKTLYEEDLIEQQKEIEKMKEDPEIKDILDSFPSAKIHSITNINNLQEDQKLINEIKKIEEK